MARTIPTDTALIMMIHSLHRDHLLLKAVLIGVATCSTPEVGKKRGWIQIGEQLDGYDLPTTIDGTPILTKAMHQSLIRAMLAHYNLE